MDQEHEMILEKTHPSGADEWYCPTCGRRLLMNYSPKFKKKILEAGDKNVIHSGGKGGLQIGFIKAGTVDNAISAGGPVRLADDPNLAPWIAWMDKIDFESLWDSED
jgi:hypothetical protein